MNPADVLEAAAEVIERDGWCQNAMRSHDGRVCLYGAIDRVITGATPERFIWADAEQDALGKRCVYLVDIYLEPDDPDAIGNAAIRFNDEKTTTATDVVDLLKHAAKDLRNRGES